MKLSTALLSITFPTLALSKSLSFLSDSQAPLGSDTDLAVPGDNPLVYCQDPSDNILAIQHVNLDPNPPNSGSKLTIEARGTFSEDVEEGAKVRLEVKYGLVKLINQEADLCEQIKNVDLKCPLKKGETNITKVIDIPKEVPPGTYHVLADVYTKDDKKITCLQATAKFGSKQKNRR
ncbi:Phosphatidylglycerol/phosphatidylinositol transfer protein [Acarospora aff. strigata]|nr:Phosphatidylglycerol/phosphatidylinositol transfer protein [Acarospora aff. strigata]